MKVCIEIDIYIYQFVISLNVINSIKCNIYLLKLHVFKQKKNNEKKDKQSNVNNENRFPK